jgi:hypothetical protein
MDTPQIVEHLISVLLGGAGGVAAGIIRITSKLSAFEQKVADLEHRLEYSTTKDNEQTRQIEALKKQVEDKLEILSRELADLRHTAMEHQAEMQRSLGSIEGTLNMLVCNGCARGCAATIPAVRAIGVVESALPSPELPRIRRP